MWTAPRTWVTGEFVTSTIMNTHVRDNFNAILPVGSYLYRAAIKTDVETAVESRWLMANGVQVLRTTYSALSDYLASLGYPFGAGNGSTTFHLPDMRGRLPVASGGVWGATIGSGDARAEAVRDIEHHHKYEKATGTFNLGSSGGANPFVSNTVVNTTGDVNNQDFPAYLNAGMWFIKYTS